MASLPRSLLASSCLTAVVLFCFSFTEANNEVVVGGKSGAWKIPSSSSDSFTKWAQNARFQVGDYLVFPYESGKDSVLKVTKEAFLTCNTSNPLSEDKDGNTRVKLERPGPCYFISGEKGHCQQGQKLVLVVITPRQRLAASPAPSPAESEGPAVAPTSGGLRLQGGLVAALLWAVVSVFLGLF